MNGSQKKKQDNEQGATKDIDQINQELEAIEEQLNDLIGDEDDDEEDEDEAEE